MIFYGHRQMQSTAEQVHAQNLEWRAASPTFSGTAFTAFHAHKLCSPASSYKSPSSKEMGVL
jgi:hypothetical protein